jgi:hypothetical protein
MGGNEPDMNPKQQPIPVTKSINAFFHCSLCLEEVMKIAESSGQSQSPSTYQRLEVGSTDIGIQIWCRRHEANVLHLDFGGAAIRASTKRANP